MRHMGRTLRRIEKVNSNLEKRRVAIDSCNAQYGLKPNPAVEKELVTNERLPTRPTKKLAVLISTYKREATTDELKAISDQPASIIRELRMDGFVFQHDGRDHPNYQYKNEAGVFCRRIVDFRPTGAAPRGRAKELVAKSIAAAVSGIEIYNKPDFKYREETFSILLVNAWELLLKAKILADTSNPDSIIDLDNTGKPKPNRSGNPHTIGIYKAMDKLIAMRHLDLRCGANIELLTAVRDNSIHFVNRSVNLSKRVHEIGTATLKNYMSVMGEWFGRDFSEFNFYLMPISFFGAEDPQPASVGPKNKQIRNLLQHVEQTEKRFPLDDDARYAVSLPVGINFVRSPSPDAFEARWTRNKDATQVILKEDDEFRRRYPMTHKDLVEKCVPRYSDFKRNRRFHALKRALEDPEKHGERYCKVRYLNPLQKVGTSQKLYSTEILKEIDKHYTRKRQ